jgi:CheY-like chemotaxis protein
LFSIELPSAAPVAMVDTGVPATQAAGRLAGLKVLCIDNEPAVLLGMQALLNGWGCTVTVADSAEQAVSGLREGKSLAPDIVLADYHLDQGTGLQAIATVREVLHSQVPAIIITADNSPEMQRDVRACGHALLRKPVKAAALRALMHQLTWQRPVAAE